ncbi:MAG TPA: response regulator transcription factor [Gaiellaceae bacterium]
MTARVLVVDDEPAIRESVGYTLRAEGHEVDEVADGASALAAAEQASYDVVVLDIMLGDLSGMEVCRRLRSTSDVPILMLTARDAEADRVLGLETGADDYVTKPFSMLELASRVRAILRRRELDRGIAFRRAGSLELDLARHEARVDGEVVRLTPTEFRLLSLLASQERAFTRREIMQHLWESSYVGDERAADVHVANLRRKIEADPADPKRIVTVRGVGYRLVAV